MNSNEPSGSTIPAVSVDPTSGSLNSEVPNHLNANACEQFLAYPFDSDKIFQEGLASIMRSTELSGQPAEEQERIIGRARAFYFTKQTGIQMTWEDIVEYRALLADAKPTPTMETTSMTSSEDAVDPEIKELSFAEISQLIQSGQTHLIPHNDVIPSGVNDLAPSAPSIPTRKKPWETQAVQEATPDNVVEL